MKVCIIAQFPPPIHGLSKAVQTLYDSKLNDKFHFSKINITHNYKVIRNIVKILTSDADLFYITVSQSKGGNLRDLLLMLTIMIRRKQFGVHIHGGMHYRETITLDSPWWQRQLNKFVLSRAQFAIVLSKSLRKNFDNLVDDSKVYVIENGVDAEFIPERSELIQTAQNRIREPIKHILYLSNFIQSKGYRKVLGMALKEQESLRLGNRQHFVFDFAGTFFDSAEKDYFFNFIKENDLDGIVRYLGIVKGTAKDQLLKDASFFCLPTSYPIEGQPISILEAMANGEFILATNHAAIPDMVPQFGGKLFDTNVRSEELYQFAEQVDDEQLSLATQVNYECLLEKYTDVAYIDRFDALLTKMEAQD